MASFEQLEIGSVGLIQQTEDGCIRQLGLTEEQSRMLQIFVASISKIKPLVVMDKEYDLVFENK